MLLSGKAKESIKTALAMTIAYAVALSMDWDRPYWAGFAVAMCSLATIGQSMNKAAMRMFGTLFAMVVALTLIALFPQDRWIFFSLLSIFTALCAYMMSGSQRAYFWHVSAFVCVIICMDGGPDATNAFQTAMLRAEQTGLGILVYTLISIFLWPTSSCDAFKAATDNLAATQLQFLRAGLGTLTGQSGEELSQLSSQQVQQKAHFDQLLNAAETDSYEVQELQHQWRSYQHLAAELMHVLERWRESCVDVRSLDIHRLLPEMYAFGAELNNRLTQVVSMLSGQPPECSPTDVTLTFDKGALRELSHFDRAAMVVLRGRMLQLEQLTCSLFESVYEITGDGKAVASVPAPRVFSNLLVLDLDRLANVVRFLMIFWSAWLAYLYIPDLPSGSGLVTMSASIGIAVANMPQVSVSKMFKPAGIAMLFSAVLYIFLMPMLSSFFGLGLMIFAVTFIVCYLNAEPRQAFGRLFGLVLFVTVASISNQQSYNFLSVANTTMMFSLVFLILTISAYIPFSPRPERAVLRFLARFFRSCDYLMETMRWDPPHPETRLERWRKAFHAREVATLPAKLSIWLPNLDPGVLPGTSMEKMQGLLASLHSLAYRIQELTEVRNTPQADFLVEQLLKDFRSWRMQIQTYFRCLAMTPGSMDMEAQRIQLDRNMTELEGRIRRVLDNAPEGRNREQDAENFYRLLGAYRSASESLVAYVENATAIDWIPWHQERF